jgi:histidine triad (HIT) family protein
MNDCIFCKIIKGEIPSFKILENNKVFCFLDINPLSRGHILVVPKEHYQDIFDIPEKELQEIISIAKELAHKVKKGLGAQGVNLINASGETAEQSVFHFHLHIVPRYKNDGLEMNKWWQSKAQKMDFGELKNLAEKLKDNN